MTWTDFEKEIEKVVYAFEHYFEKEQSEHITYESLTSLERNIIVKFDFFYCLVEDGMIINGKKRDGWRINNMHFTIQLIKLHM